MRERPILMTPENAQKCHDGTKTQTRRLNGLEEVNSGLWDYPQMTKPGVFTFLDTTQANPYNNALDVKCPYGVVGDRLWVRESYCCEYDDDCIPIPGRYFYKGTGVEVRTVDGDGFQKWRKDGTECSPWIPSIHMPRFACRTVLEITDVRVERLQDIGEEDAKAEGVTRIDHGREYYFSAMRDEPDHRNWGDPTDAYKELWESINGAGSWAQNPWVWVIAFRKVGACGR